ncbi:mitotic spindle assembly checkpoint protein MAD1 isoform X8 [Lates calcarifer]|uniref:Mitotic spindle assembly checkpoint protein MAD1 n=1 Tax=Lates calcarifer TaxID=8187 RepID=A0A4W6DMP8_LATCA|nr:mitotic spindle assembly checkpoint protein MAD1 isoform X1 [Lates calcarifer]XP_018558115.1 mitotic spindle assembly checkpoint protein MAD1 isoform X1 [Lates calcarifer]XP_018558116.1 mitotic spindle assembly checkpoint protein MAD1 isoform X1 [Lates calcarifer]XP_050926455.1 mitotic spindle assembly checkpoint protein MAD1 isoform X2 [Lates calcarifer]XP_050926456.1 mitotic spindle assembly checkpoint protein MAD1 isoform X3 [Lates calcarifer]XP_050926457.1 mitotic spindle assembly check
MDLEDDTTVLTTLKSFNSFISRPEHPQRLSDHSAGSGNLQSQYKRSMELLEAAEQVYSKNRYLQLDQEKKQMEMSHKRARFELEKAASDSARDLEHEIDRNQELLGRIKKLEERETEAAKNLSEQVEANRALRKNLEGLNKKLEERDSRLNTANQTVSSLKDEIRELKQKIQNKDSTISTQTLENQELQEQLDLQRRKYQEVSQVCQNLQAAQSSCSEHIIKIKELERRLALQEQDIAIVKTVKSEVARVPDLEKELKRLRDDNAFLRESRENCSLLKEEVEGLRRKLERMEKTKEELVNMELDKERLAEKLQAWENLGQSTGLNIRKPEDLSREVIQIQQREIALKEQNYTLNSRVRSVERSQTELRAELSQQRSKTLEEQKKRESQDALVRRLQKRVLLLTKERDGMRAILESYDSELAPTEYSPQLSKRLREAEDVLQKTQNHNAEMEAQLTKAQEETGTLRLQLQTVELELDSLKKQQASAADSSSLATKEEVSILRQKIEDLEAERQRLEEQNNVLEMRLERHNLQGDYDPVKTRVLHLKMNPTAVAKQQRQQEVEALREEVTHLRELVRSLQDGGSLVHSQDDSSMHSSSLGLSLPPSKEILDLRKQMESSELRNQRLKEVFQRKIQEFRTVCYVLTGYQIDITTENQYRLTSVYAEHMDDSLLFKKGSNGSMQLMETEFSKTLGEMVALHLHHQKSIPAFLSAVTLDLFSRQTTI